MKLLFMKQEVHYIFHTWWPRNSQIWFLFTVHPCNNLTAQTGEKLGFDWMDFSSCCAFYFTSTIKRIMQLTTRRRGCCPRMINAIRMPVNMNTLQRHINPVNEYWLVAWRDMYLSHWTANPTIYNICIQYVDKPRVSGSVDVISATFYSWAI